MTIRERVFVLATSRIGQACLALLATVPSVWGGSSVWEVGSGVNSVYIAGAVNVLQETDYPLPAEYYAAYADSSRLVFEVDASEKMDPGVGGSMMRMGLLEGKTLDKVLSKDVYRILEKYCKEAGLPMETAKHYRPSHVIGALFLNAKKELEVFQHGAETHFYLQAVQDGKKLGYLETMGEQVEFLVSLEGKDDNGYVMHSLAELDKLKEHYEDTFTAWKFGDIEYFDRHYIQGMKEAYPELYKTVVVDRNLKWMSKILPAFRTPEKEFFLVGISHLAGEDGILERLSALGYNVRKLKVPPGRAMNRIRGYLPETREMEDAPAEAVDLEIVPTGGFPLGYPERLQRDLEERLGLSCKVTQPMPLDPGIYSKGSRQMDAFAIGRAGLAWVKRGAYPSQKPFVLVLTQYETNLRPFDAPFLFASGSGEVAVVSVARMDPGQAAGFERDLMYTRLEKIARRAIGQGYYRYEFSRDRRSVMYAPLEGVEDLDRMWSGYPLDRHGALEFFNRYVVLSGQYSEELAYMYSDKARIIAKWYGHEGRQQGMEVMTGREYKALLAKQAQSRETSKYSHVNVILDGMNAMIRAQRRVGADGFVDLDFHLMVSRQKDGSLAIMEEQKEIRESKEAFVIEEPSLYELLQAQERGFAKILPMMVAANTRLDSVQATADTLVYRHTLLTAEKDGLDITAASELLSKEVTRKACGDPRIRKILRLGGKVLYLYMFADGSTVAVVRVDQKSSGETVASKDIGEKHGGKTRRTIPVPAHHQFFAPVDP